MAPLTGKVDSVPATRRGAFSSVTLLMLLGLSWSLFSLRGCDKTGGDPNKVEMKISGKTYVLEVVADPKTREKGMGDRTVIPDGTGMLFAFPDQARRDFVMRDCPIPIDIIFIDAAGRVTATHAMEKETPRKPGEDAMAYERRLKLYSSRFPAQFAIEIMGGGLKGLSVKTGDKLEFDTEGLKKRAK